MPTLPSYVLITPARDKAQFIELTTKSVVAQTVRPLKWVIVSGGSTDGTDDGTSKYAASRPRPELVRMSDGTAVRPVLEAGVFVSCARERIRGSCHLASSSGIK